MKKNNLTVLTLLGLTVLLIVFPEIGFARDLGSAASSAVSTAKTIARVLSVFGLLVGGISLQLPGLSGFGRNTLGAGLIGCLCSFGGPALISFFETVFGGG